MENDTIRLDLIQKAATGFGNGFILRYSKNGRGLRLHETTDKGASKNVREAIDNFFASHKFDTDKKPKTDLLDELERLRKENPSMEVVHMVDSDLCSEGDSLSYHGRLSKVYIGMYCFYGDTIHHDECSLKDELGNDFYDEDDHDKMSDEEYEKFIEEEYDKLEKKDVIYVEIGM